MDNVILTRKQILKLMQAERTPCMVYTRVMGYHRPVESFNHGKLGEHLERSKFCEKNCINVRDQ